MKKASRWVLFFLTVLLLGIVGCTSASSSEKSETEMAEGTYRIYTIGGNGTKLSYRYYQTETTDPAQLLEELLRELQAMPDAVDETNALPDNVTVQQISLSGSVLYVHFDDNYSKMTPQKEILCRAAVVKTLTQPDAVDTVSFYLNDAEMTNADGTAIGFMSAGDFIEQITEEDELQTQNVTLYFTDESGSCLLSENREIRISAVTSLERAVVEQLLAGPQEEGHYATLPGETDIESVIIRDGICYVSLDETFLSDSLDLNPEVIIYSLVDTLSELSSVSKVQITIDGESKIMFKDTISLENPLDRNLSLVETQ